MTSYRLAISDPVPSALESTETEASTTTNLQTPIPLSSNDKSLDASTEPVNTPDASNSSLSTLPPTQPSRLSELLTADTGPRLSNSAKDPVKTNANAKYRKAKNSNSGKFDLLLYISVSFIFSGNVSYFIRP